MRVETQRKIDRWFGVAILAVLSVINRLVPRRPVDRPRAILILLISEMGSLVCAQPMVLELRRRYPEASLHVLLLKKNRGVVDLLGLFEDRHVHLLDDRSATSLLRSLAAALRALWRARIDTVIDCELFARISAIIGYLSGARLRIGFHPHNQEGLYRGSVVNRPVPYNPYVHISAQFLVLVGAMEGDSRPLGKTVVIPDRVEIQHLPFSDDEVRAAGARFLADFPVARGRRLVMLYPGSGILPIRAWPLDRFEAVARTFVAQGFAVAVIGLPEDRPLGEHIVAASGSDRCLNLAGYTRSLRDLVLLFRHADLLISNDGGPGHFAALTPLPVVSLFGPETPTLYAPLCRRGEALFRQLPCAPCLTAYNHRNTACDGENWCLRAIETRDVVDAAHRLLEVAP